MDNRINLQSIPEELKTAGKFCVWKYVIKKNKKTKIPYQINHTAARVNHPEDWVSFKKIEPWINFYDGVGLLLQQDQPYVAIDLDHCIKDGKLTRETREIVDFFDSYTEISPSGEGIHIIIKCSPKPDRAFRKEGIEVYSDRRYMTITGNVLKKLPIADRTLKLGTFLTDGFKEENYSEPVEDMALGTFTANTISKLSEEAQKLVKLIFSKRTRLAYEFRKLYKEGDISICHNDDSLADYHLLSTLSYYSGKNVTLMMEVFAQSPLAQRDKWINRPDYRERTIRNVIKQTRNIYHPKMNK